MAKGRAAANPVTGLTAKQEEFCFQTIRLGNANRAYVLVYDASGMMQSSVRAAVKRLLDNASITHRLHELQEVADTKLNVTIERIARELACIGFSRSSDLYDDDGNLIPPHLLPDDVARAVSSVEIIEKGVDVKASKKGKGGDGDEVEFIQTRLKKIRLYDKQPALQTMARWKKMIKDRPDDEDADPNDVTRLTDAEVEEQLKANQAALEMIERARKRRSPVKKKAEARATKAG